jgi:hypothetical protein
LLYSAASDEPLRRARAVQHQISFQDKERSVLFHITQVHTPETCPRDEGGSNTLYDPNVPGVKLIGRYGANAQHVLFYIVEADDAMAIQRFLWPGFKRSTATVTPVIEVPVSKK